jgi:hypothetical protein
MDAFALRKDGQGRLVLERPGQDPVVDVRVRAAFPWSDPGRFVSLRGPDGKEILLIEDLSALAPALQTLVREYMASERFVPRIRRVERVDLRFGYQEWRVRTDRGPIEFRVQEREDIRFMPDGRFEVHDADGNVYELPRLDQLDPHSLRCVEALL